ncbi:MAG: DUF2332 domain-containing protein, partial [Nocardioides sp.]|nr:DUF2332 domain-containing protein [Nocardioides sp.]
SPMYAALCEQLADDLAAGGPTSVVLAGHEDDPGPTALALRLLGSVHRLVLERRAGALAAYYPSVGGTWEPEAGWLALRALLAAEPGTVREWLDLPPQTNEVGRATALMAGLLALPWAHPVRLFEIGSSGGLNLLADHFRYVTPDGSVGPQDSPVVLDPAWTGALPLPGSVGEPPRIVERLGSDVMPVDVRNTEGRLTLTAYVWPDQTHRLERLRGAFALADRIPYALRRETAGDLVADLELVDGTTTVLWHSVMWQYLGRDEQDRVRAGIDALGARATAAAPFAHVYLEPSRRTPGAEHEFLVWLETWPAGELRVLGTSVGHGVPTHVE